MKRIRSTLKFDRTDESGVSLVEVMVAMFIFAIISLGVAYTLIQSLDFVKDSRARSAAANLAAQEIDRARATTDVFTLFDDSYTQSVGGRNYTVNRITRWVSDPSQDVPCGASGGALQYKRVNVTVTWPGMRNALNPVRSDTLIAAKTRISDPELATILVSVSDRLAAGVQGVTITTSPSLTPAPSATDIQGCSYVLKVPPGSYTIRISKSGYVDPLRVAQPTQDVVLTAGSSVNASFKFDQRQSLPVTYAPAPATIPNNMDTSLLHGSDAVRNFPATTNAKSRTIADLYPFVEGYTALAGRYVARNETVAGCLSPHPLEWATGEVDAISYSAPHVQPVVPPASVTVPMGVFSVTGTANNQSLTAVSVASGPAGTANPGCANQVMTYRFGTVLSNGATREFALPYGSWQLYYTNGTPTIAQLVPFTRISVPALPSTVDLLGVVTLDPRVPTP